MRIDKLLIIVSAAAVPGIAFGLYARGAPPQGPAKPAEESRLSTAVFREGLKQRGLTELLDLHLNDFPPTGPTEILLMKRDVKLAEFADLRRAKGPRLDAVAEANRILEQLVDENPEDPRRFGWMFTLARSLIYDEGEPFFTSILYRGGSRADRDGLLAQTSRAVSAITSLVEQLETESDRIDGLSIIQFEKLERNGYVAEIDQLVSQADYLRLWILFYDALARADADPVRARRLNRVLQGFAENPALLETSHARSRVQVQTLVLAGMTHRLLNNHAAAREHLDRAVRVADRISTVAQRRRIAWATKLAGIERIRSDRDAGRFEAALRAITRFREQSPGESKEDFGMRLVAALLERSVIRARATHAAALGKQPDVERYREEAWKPLARLADREPERRDEIYAALYELIDPEADPGSLDPFEQSALLAGLLSDASEDADQADAILKRAIQVGKRFQSQEDTAASSLASEVLYNLAVAQFHLGNIPDAAARFLKVARDHPEYEHALQAATFAVQLAFELYQDPDLRDHPEVRGLYRTALEVLVSGYTDSEAARYWQFYYAQLLDELERYDKAAAHYALVDAAHEHYLTSRFFRVRGLARALAGRASGATVDMLTFRKDVDAFFAAQRDFVTGIGAELPDVADPERITRLRSYLARASLLAAEVQVLPHVDRAARALETLSGFENDHPNETGVIGRVWRVRLLAFERLGRLDEAARAVFAYIDADPSKVGPTLQSLYESMSNAIDGLRAAGEFGSAQRKADVALVLAQQISSWTRQYGERTPQGDIRMPEIQLAEANLRAGRHERARELFESCLAPDGGAAASADPIDLRVLFGYAESSFRLGDYAAALPRFNRIALSLAPTDSLRWKALLRDLQCRNESGQPPTDIIKVIEQQKFLYPDLGGPLLAPQFEKLLRENKRRADRKTTSG